MSGIDSHGDASASTPRTPAPENPIEVLERWQQFGGTWAVIAGREDQVTISLRRCDGGEEQQRLTSDDPALLTWLDGRNGSDLPFT